MTRTLFSVLVFLLLAGICNSSLALTDAPAADHHSTRKIVKKVLPDYPPLARQLDIKGMVKLLVTVEASGKVKSAKPLGGNPAFVDAAMNVIEKWRFEPAPQQTVAPVEIKFEPAF